MARMAKIAHTIEESAATSMITEGTESEVTGTEGTGIEVIVTATVVEVTEVDVEEEEVVFKVHNVTLSLLFYSGNRGPPRGPPEERPVDTVYITGLGPQVKESELAAHFGSIGVIRVHETVITWLTLSVG